MSAKIEHKIRKAVRRKLKFVINDLKALPFSNRIKIAWSIVRGSKA